VLKFVAGDFFDFEADIMVNTVNCVGVMGAGVALAFKNRFPDMFQYYFEQCRSGQVKPGRPSVWINRDMISKDVEIINFPTKNDWRKPSEYSYVEDGLRWLALYLKSREGAVVTLPALGCGHGGLDWSKVKSLIEKYLQNSPAEILVFEPSSSKKAGKSIINKEYPLELYSAGIDVIDVQSLYYPSSLIRYTKKDLFVYPSGVKFFGYDFSLICSSRPSELERVVVEGFVELCIERKMSVLLGGSAYEKKLALKSSGRGLRVACFLPSGILSSAKKLVAGGGCGGNLSLLSIGSPMGEFDKKEYLPSVLSRIYMAKKNLFTTGRLSWLSRYEKRLNKDGVNSYFCFYDDLGSEDVVAAVNSGAKSLNIDFIQDGLVVEALMS
jgi:O-acetyl-ADP-ribose deacetylase (regulator of RNase III)